MLVVRIYQTGSAHMFSIERLYISPSSSLLRVRREKIIKNAVVLAGGLELKVNKNGIVKG